MHSGPSIVVIGGPNGAGKSTSAPGFVPAGVPYLNADEVAKTLHGYPSPAVDRLAAVHVLTMMRDLEGSRSSYAVETTLATRTLAQRISRLRRSGYQFVLRFLWTPNPEFSIRRVEQRVRSGGHSIPEETIRRRHAAGTRNLFRIYLPLADDWSIYVNSEFRGVVGVAYGGAGRATEVLDPGTWEAMSGRGRP